MEVREVNRIASGEEDEEPARPWKLDIEASGRNQLMVTGLGLDSEWRADLQIGGDTNQMAISGTANLVRGAYEFAGKRFELTRGQIRLDRKSTRLHSQSLIRSSHAIYCLQQKTYI